MNTIEDTIIILLHDLLDAGQLNLQNDNFYNIKEDIFELLNETIPEKEVSSIYASWSFSWARLWLLSTETYG